MVSNKTLNPQNDQGYGDFRVWGDAQRTRYFSIGEQADIEPLIRDLSVAAHADSLGRSFQGLAAVKRLSSADESVLREYAKDLGEEPAAKSVAEIQLELAMDDSEAAVEAVLAKIDPDRRQVLLSRIQRNRLHAQTLRDQYEGRCQICEWAPRESFREDLCEGHHINWLSRGGHDEISNMVLLCPNHHRAVHKLNAIFDWANKSFVAERTDMPLVLMKHDLKFS